MMGAGILTLGTVLIALLAARPTPPSVDVVLLPQADGTPSSVVVVSGPDRQTLSAPYQRATATQGQPPTQDSLDPAAVQQAYPALFSAMPPPPAEAPPAGGASPRHSDHPSRAPRRVG